VPLGTEETQRPEPGLLRGRADRLPDGRGAGPAVSRDGPGPAAL
ncbi:MAG: hypothetical protein AVDCRST_MAG03-975, partial [uncultured Rubrobacteraceae bacterium]